MSARLQRLEMAVAAIAGALTEGRDMDRDCWLRDALHNAGKEALKLVLEEAEGPTEREALLEELGDARATLAHEDEKSVPDTVAELRAVADDLDTHLDRIAGEWDTYDAEGNLARHDLLVEARRRVSKLNEGILDLLLRSHREYAQKEREKDG